MQSEIGKKIGEAVLCNDIGTVRYLVENNKVEAIDLNNCCLYGVSQKHLDIAKYLIEKGADVDIAFRISINKATRGDLNKEYFVFIEYLVSKGADVTIEENYGVIVASRRGYIDLVKYLVSKGADVDIALLNTSRFGDFDLVKYLISKGGNISKTPEELFENACRSGNLEMVDYFYTNIGINSINIDKALEEALYFKHGGVAKYLIEKGAGGDAALLSSINFGNLEIAEFLISQGEGKFYIRLLALLRLYVRTRLGRYKTL